MVRGRVAGDSVADVGPASVMVGNIVQGNRLASAQGRDMGVLDEDSDNAKKVCVRYTFLSPFFFSERQWYLYEKIPLQSHFVVYLSVH